ncbi:MAG TPA: GGDEF domain-containing protein [Fimbriiglobus sp.]|nr:GGDEF domain-containing protein [Fimbriiglobus sp.]
MTDPFQNISFLATVIQAVGIVLVAGLLLPMTRAIPGRFLRYWSLGWVCQAAGLFSLYASARYPEYRVESLIGYCLADYLFGFLLWAGCWDYAAGERLRAGHLLALGPPVIFGVTAPILLRDALHLFPFHVMVFGAMFLTALLATRRAPVRPHTPTIGLWLVRGSLAALVLLNVHYAAVGGYYVYFHPDGWPAYLEYTTLYDVLLQTGLAFGMVVLAADRMREELESRNRQLAAATEELAQAARTDTQTGLLNRRAFDELLNGPAAPADGSLAVIDLNDLKPLNDRYGHQAGDAALQHLARALRAHFRVTDPMFRVGGDEFVVVMVGCAEADLSARLARIDEALQGQRLPGVDGPIDLGVAWGVAGFAAAAGLMTAYDAADKAMYARKRTIKAQAKTSSHEFTVR